jgi:hypothetical protein
VSPVAAIFAIFSATLVHLTYSPSTSYIALRNVSVSPSFDFFSSHLSFLKIKKSPQGIKWRAYMDDVLRSEKIAVERKNFSFDLKENPRGRFLRITEDVNGRRDTIIIPAPGLEDFRRILDLMIATNNQNAVPEPGR